MAYAARMDGSRRFTTIAGVAAIHGLIGYVFISGMATSFVEKVTTPFITTNIPIETPPPPEITPPKLEKVSPRQTSVAPPRTTVTPIVPSQANTNTVVVVVTPPLPPIIYGTGTVTVDPPTIPTTVSKASGVLARGNRNDWITTDDYPPSAIRAEEEGVVGIALRIGADGRSQSCTVTASSGHASLDQATCRLYQRRARFIPARDDAGAAVAATFTDRIRWQLPK